MMASARKDIGYVFFTGEWITFQRELGISKGLIVSKEPKFSQEQDGIGNWILLDIVYN
jgi:hypothetical protein